MRTLSEGRKAVYLTVHKDSVAIFKLYGSKLEKLKISDIYDSLIKYLQFETHVAVN